MNIEKIKRLLGNEFVFVFNETNPVIQGLNLDKDAKILDIGTGKANMAITLALNDFSIITGEPEDDESKYAKQDWLKSAKKAQVDHLIKFTPFNAEKMPFEDSYFDSIFIQGAIHHFGDKKATLEECERVLKKNGSICIFEPNREMSLWIRESGDKNHPDSVDPRDYAQELSLSVELIKRRNYDAFILKKTKEKKSFLDNKPTIT